MERATRHLGLIVLVLMGALVVGTAALSSALADDDPTGTGTRAWIDPDTGDFDPERMPARLGFPLPTVESGVGWIDSRVIADGIGIGELVPVYDRELALVPAALYDADAQVYRDPNTFRVIARDPSASAVTTTAG